MLNAMLNTSQTKKRTLFIDINLSLISMRCSVGPTHLQCILILHTYTVRSKKLKRLYILPITIDLFAYLYLQFIYFAAHVEQTG